MSDDTASTATVTTRYRDAATATVVANAVRPDNTDDVTTGVDGATVRTEVQRGSVGSLSSSVDDYVVNVGVAAAVVGTVDGRPPDASGDADGTEQTAADSPRTADGTEQTAADRRHSTDSGRRTPDDTHQTTDDTRHHE